MPRTLPAALTTVMDAGIYEPYLKVVVSDTPSGGTTVDPLAFTLEALKATVKIAKFSNDTDVHVWFRIVRGAIISGTPSTISSIWFKTIDIRYDGKFVTLTGEALEKNYLSIAADSSYKDVIETALTRLDDTIVPSFEGTAAWKDYQFYPTGKAIVLSPRMKLFTLLHQKYLVFATEDGYDGVDSNIFFFVAAQARTADYTFINVLFEGIDHIEYRKLISRDEGSTIHTTGVDTNQLHNLGFLHSTAVHPPAITVLGKPYNPQIGARSSKLPVHLKYRTGDHAICLGDDSTLNILQSRINVIEILDLESTPAWYNIIEQLIWFGGTEGGAMPSTIEAAAPYTPLATGNFAGVLSANDNNIQAAMETIDDHSHGSSAPATTALDDFQMGNGSGAWITKTLAQAVTRIRTILDAIYSAAAHTHEVDQRADMFSDAEGAPADLTGTTNVDGTSAYGARRDHAHQGFKDSEGDPAAIGPAADGTSAYGARRDHVHAITNGEAILGSAFSITGTAGTYQDTGLSITLPSAGIYNIIANIRGALTGNVGALWWITAKLYNSTDAADIANSERLIVLTGTTAMRLEMTTAIVAEGISVAASKVIKVYAFRNGTSSPSWTLSRIDSGADGRSSLSYEKIG